ncbi:type VI secretion system-associated FHA domain protein TagH [Frigidibacter sp. SLM-1]|nr:type VI secretion system-associated FHA domain protein TagH [Frigidibacter sp. ROC022]
MRGPSLTIGRGAGNDMVLPDPDRMVSGTHCVIENHNGNVVVVDLSTNGTFLNYGKVPLGKTPTPLNSGDVLTIGPYELVVEIAKKGEVIADPLAEEGVGFGNAKAAPDPLDLLEAPGPGGDFLDDLLGPSSPPTGPSQFKAEPDDPFDSLLAPLGDEEDPFFGAKDPGYEGPSAQDHASSTADAFRPAQPKAGIIPDDWDDLLDLGKPDPATPAPAAAPAQPAAVPTPAKPAPARRYGPDGKPLPEDAAPAAAPAPPPETDDDPFGLGGDTPSVDAPPPAAPEIAAEPAAEPAAPTEAAKAAPQPAAAGAADSGDTARAFLRTLGADDKIPADELHPTMIRLASVLKAMITGIREILMTRTQIKGEFRIDQTMISAGGNNPLKFSITPEQAIEAMAKTHAKGYLGAKEATEQALSDIKAHEVAMVTGMEAALKGVLKKLDPKVLEEKLEGKAGGFLSNKKAKYWEAYEDMYSEISDQAENQFHDLFAREFAAAYKNQLERLK